MLKRLIIAVLAMGLVLAFSSTAISDVGTRTGINPVMKIDPTNARFNDISEVNPTPNIQRIPSSSLREVTMGGGAPPVPTSGYFCDADYYYDDTATSVFVFSSPDYWGLDAHFYNVRFSVEEGISCTLKTAWVLTYGGYLTGDAGLRIYLFDDDGFGFPGNVIDSADVPNADLIGGFTWVDGDFSGGNYVFSEGEDYHYAIDVIANDAEDTVWIVSDKGTGPYAGEGRNSVYIGAWTTYVAMQDLLSSGADDAFFFDSERCCADLPFSDCYTQNYSTANSFYWPAPHPIYGDSSYAQRVDIGGDDTLTSIDVYVYDPGDGSFGNDNITLRILESNGGLPGADTASYSFAAGSYSAYPASINITYPAATIVTSDFFVAFSSDGIVDYESVLSDNGSAGVGGSFSVWDNTTGWVDMLAGWGADVNFNFDINICRDQFSQCQWNSYYAGFAYYWRYPDRYGDIAAAQKIIVPSSMVGCRPQQVDWFLYNNGEPDIYTENSEVQIYADAAGLPGTMVASMLLTPADYNMFPAVTSVDFTAAQLSMDGDYWVAIKSLSTDTLTGIRTLTDDIFTGGGGNFDGAAEGWDNGSGGLDWGLMWVDWGVPAEDMAFLVDVEHCCIPVPEWDCSGVGDEWSTINHDQGRTSHSSNPLGDAYADLSLSWQFEHPSQGVGFTSPIIVQGKVICSFTTEYIVFDAASGAQDYALGGNPLGGAIRCAPTVANIGGTDLMFVSGGTFSSIVAYVFATGAPVWSYNVGGSGGITRWGNFIVLNVGGTDLLFSGTDDGLVRALDAATGAPVWETDLGSSTWASGATNGNLLFYATDFGGINGDDGDVVALNSTNGAIMWQLSTDGLMGVDLYDSSVANEYFSGGLAYSDGEVYANARVGSGDHPADGIFYRIAAVSGSRLSAVRSGRTIYATPAVDAGAIFLNTLSRWLTPPLGGQVFAYGRTTGTLKMSYNRPSGGGGYGSMAISCEPDGVPDILVATDDEGFIDFFSTENLDNIFRRRIDWGPFPNSIALGVALGPNGDMAVADFWGGLYYLKKGARGLRPRLEVQSYRPAQAVEFGNDANYEVTFENLFVNTGGADLIFGNIDVDENTFGYVIPAFSASYVSEDVMERASSIADMLTDQNFRVKATPANEIVNESSMQSVRDLDRGREVLNMAAAIPPAIFNAITQPLNGHALAAGDSLSLKFTIDQNLITRGPAVMYMLVNSDDPDFFLNSAARGTAPELLITLVGGCLMDTISMPFGMGSANTHLVTNVGRIATGDWSPFGMEIDGFQDGFWQGTYIYGVSQHRLALQSDDWHGGVGAAWISMQPDPDFCDNACAPLLQTDVPLCAPVSRDGGLTYDEIRGNMVCKSYIDSVQNFDDGGGWYWRNVGSPFDNDSTMGLYVNTRTVGAVDVPELNNMTIEFYEVTERNGADVPGWKFGALMDCDIYQTAGGGADTVWYDASISAGWASPVGQTGYAWGFIKLPFGCGLDPLKNVYSIDANQAMWHDSDVYLDSAYHYMSMPQGASGHQVTGSADMEFHTTIVEHDFTGNESFKFAVAAFGYNNLADGRSSAEFAYNAHFANKWIGFGRGDVNDDQLINLGDIIRLAEIVNGSPNGAVPFAHLADVNVDGNIDGLDLDQMLAWYFGGPCGSGGCPAGGAWCF